MEGQGESHCLKHWKRGADISRPAEKLVRMNAIGEAVSAKKVF